MRHTAFVAVMAQSIADPKMIGGFGTRFCELFIPTTEYKSSFAQISSIRGECYSACTSLTNHFVLYRVALRDDVSLRGYDYYRILSSLEWIQLPSINI